MNPAELKEALSKALEDDALLGRLCDRLAERLETSISFAVAAAVAEKDNEIRALKTQLQETGDQLNEVEQYSRKQCLNIQGVTETPGESVRQLVLEMAGAVGADVSPGDLDVAHRVGRPRDGKTRVIIARFVSFTARQNVYDKRRELRNANAVPNSSLTTATLRDIYVSDNLTRRNEETMYHARQMKKGGKIWAAWSDNGKMKIKQEKNGPTRIIRSTEDLRGLVGDESAPPAGVPGSAAGSAAGGEGERDGSRPGGSRRAGGEDSARGRGAAPRRGGRRC